MMSETSKIRGLIVPVAWDSKGTVTEVAVAAYNEDEYLLNSNTKAEELLSLIHKEVEIIGVTTGASGNRPIIEVHEYRVLSKSAADNPFN